MGRVLWMIALAASVVFCVASWRWAVTGASATRYPAETWIDAPAHAPGFAYRRFLVTLNNGDTYHVEGTHYVWTQGMALTIKDASRDVTVWATSAPVATINEERP